MMNSIVKNILLVFLVFIFSGCATNNGRLIRFFDGEIDNDESITYYRILNSKLYKEEVLLGDLDYNNRTRSVELLLNEKNEKLSNDESKYKEIFSKSKIVTRYNYEVGKMIIDEISSQNGICADFNNNKPISRKSSINLYYRNSNNLRMVMRFGYKISKDASKKYDGDYSQFGLEKLEANSVDNVQKDSKEFFRKLLNNSCQ